MTNRRRIVSFDGISCSGKSTIIDEMQVRLKDAGILVYNKADLLHYQGDSVGAAIKKILAAGSPSFRLGLPATETLLICAKRAYEWQTSVEPLLNKGAVVLCDRDIDTVCAYQLEVLKGWRNRLSQRQLTSLLRSVNELSCANPGLTFSCEVSIDVSYERLLGTAAVNDIETPRSS